MRSKKTKQISISEYALKVNPDYFKMDVRRHDETIERKRGTVSQQAIKYRIKMGLPLPDVIRHNQIGKVHVLTVNVDF